MTLKTPFVRPLLCALALTLPATAQHSDTPSTAQPAQPAPSTPAPAPSAPAQAPAPSAPDASAPAGAPTFKVLDPITIAPDPGDAPRLPRTSFVHGLAFKSPMKWRFEQPSNPMRILQVVVPAIEGSGAGDATLVAFANIGGTVDDNINRWLGQFSDVVGQPTKQELTLGLLIITQVVIEGTYNAAMPGAPAQPTPNTMLYGAVVEGGEAGPLFVRMTGPSETMKARRTGWDVFIRNFNIDRRHEARPGQGAPGQGAPGKEGR